MSSTSANLSNPSLFSKQYFKVQSFWYSPFNNVYVHLYSPYNYVYVHCTAPLITA